MESALLDTGAPEISADGLDHVEVVGTTVKWVYYTVRWSDGQPERRERVTVSMPLAMVDGGLAFIRERYHGRVCETEPQHRPHLVLMR